MNREIKFRAWSKIAQQVIPWEQLKPKFIKLLDNSEYPYMQYTGLKDINGKEIYEGDILKIHGWGIGKVIFFEGRFCVINNKKEMYYWIAFCKPDHSPYKPKIIGTIFENPELLKEEQ
jgi:uncharacterized phage protein (TIGR01671 family)